MHFIRIWIEENAGLYAVVKESGAGGRVLDRRSWKTETVEEAKGFVARKIKEKTNPARKSPRCPFKNHQFYSILRLQNVLKLINIS
jgi:hypothetical protein